MTDGRVESLVHFYPHTILGRAFTEAVTRTVKDMPKGYTDWMQNNAERIENAKNMPYFIKDNYVGGEVEGGLKWKPNNKLTIQERADMRHAARTQDDVDAIQTAWNRRRIENNGDGYNLTSIERSINKYGVDRTEFDALMAKPLKYDKLGYEFPQLVALEDKYRDLADINVNKAVMVRGELFGYRLEAEHLGAKGKKYAERIYKHILQIDKKADATAYWLSGKEDAQIANAKRKIEELKAHREEVLKAWQERKAMQSADVIDRIGTADSSEALAKIMKDARIAKDFDLGNMSLVAQKTIAETAAKIQNAWGLEPIDIRMKAFPKKDGNTFMWANGGKVEANSKYWAKDALAKTTTNTFDNCVTSWKERHENNVLTYKAYIEDWEKKLKSTTDAWYKSWYEKKIKQYTKLIKQEQLMINSGMSRHNVFLSKETMLRDCFTHETGHTVHDQILGGLNGAYYRQKKFNVSDATVLDEELKALWKKHKKTGGGWLSEYGLSSHKEFMSESFVLYHHAPDKLPADVKAWFDLLHGPSTKPVWISRICISQSSRNMPDEKSINCT